MDMHIYRRCPRGRAFTLHVPSSGMVRLDPAHYPAFGAPTMTFSTHGRCDVSQPSDDSRYLIDLRPHEVAVLTFEGVAE